jgi:hypothetical protein
VEDFINTTSNVSMSSIPVQFLIYVMPTPVCGLAPEMLPFSRCFDAEIGVQISFNVSAVTLCDPNVSGVNTILVTSTLAGVNFSDTNDSPTNASVGYATITWTPQASELGLQQLCTVAYSE